MSPVYNYICTFCNKEWEACHTIAERYNEECCGKQANKIIAKPRTSLSTPVVYDYYCHGSGEYITGRKQRERVLKKKGLEAVG